MELERLEVFCLCNSFSLPQKKSPEITDCGEVLIKKLLEKEGVQENPRYMGTKRNAK